MDILDKHFMELPGGKKTFILIVGAGYFFVALFSVLYGFTNMVESLLIMVVGLLFTELLKLESRIEILEKKKKK